MRLLLAAVGTTLLLGGCESLSNNVTAADPAVAEGRRLFARSCAGCHAAGPEARSTYRAARPAALLASEFTPESLQRAAAHKGAHEFAMPSIVLTPTEAGNILAYMRALAAADPAERRRLAPRPCIATSC